MSYTSYEQLWLNESALGADEDSLPMSQYASEGIELMSGSDIFPKLSALGAPSVEMFGVAFDTIKTIGGKSAFIDMPSKLVTAGNLTGGNLILGIAADFASQLGPSDPGGAQQIQGAVSMAADALGIVATVGATGAAFAQVAGAAAISQVVPIVGQIAGAVAAVVGALAAIFGSGPQVSAAEAAKMRASLLMENCPLTLIQGAGSHQEGGQKYSKDILVPADIFHPWKIIGGKKYMSSLGQALIAITELNDPCLEAAKSSARQSGFRNDPKYIASIDKWGLPTSYRVAFRKLRQAIQKQFLAAKTDGGMSLWSVYQELLYQAYENGYLNDMYAQYKLFMAQVSCGIQSTYMGFIDNETISVIGTSSFQDSCKIQCPSSANEIMKDILNYSIDGLKYGYVPGGPYPSGGHGPGRYVNFINNKLSIYPPVVQACEPWIGKYNPTTRILDGGAYSMVRKIVNDYEGKKNELTNTPYVQFAKEREKFRQQVGMSKDIAVRFARKVSGVPVNPNVDLKAFPIVAATIIERATVIDRAAALKTVQAQVARDAALTGLVDKQAKKDTYAKAGLILAGAGALGIGAHYLATKDD